MAPVRGADDGGLDMFKRTFQPFAIGGMGANYYPQIFEAYVEDDSARLALLTKQPHGVTSATSGEIEMMLHRRTSFHCCGGW